MNKKLIAVTLLFVLSGCSISRVNDTMKENEKRADKISQMVKDVGRPVVTKEPAPWINRKPVTADSTDRSHDVPCNISYRVTRPIDIYQFAQDISEQCSIPVKVTADVAWLMSGGSTGGGQVQGTQTNRLSGNIPSPTLDQNGMVPLATLNSGSGGGGGFNALPGAGSGQGLPKISDFHYTGRVAGAMNVVTSRMGVSWSFDGSAMKIFYVDTKVFTLKTSNAKFSQSSSQKSGITTTGGSDSSSSSSGTSGNSGVSTSSGSETVQTTEMSNDIYKDMLASVKQLINPAPIGSVSLNDTTGALIVRDTPEGLARVSSFIDSQNNQLSKQFKLEITVYKITSELSDNFDLKMGLVYKSLSNQYGINLTSTSASSASGMTGGGVDILDTASGKLASLAGSSLLFDAISEQTKNFESKTLSVMTTNMATSGIQLAQHDTYKRRVSISAITSGTSSQPIQSIEPGEITTGTDLIVTPRYLPGDEKLQLTMNLNISSLKSMRTIGNSSGSSSSTTESIEGPSTDSRSIPQRVWLKPGQTVVMSGYELITENADKAGVGSPSNFLFGGKSVGDKVKESFVITITPVME